MDGAFRTDAMSYRFQGDEALPDGVRRIAGGEIAVALGRLKSTATRDETVHEVRKSVKKIRGLLRLIEPGLGEMYARENAEWRDIGRRLSELRDAGAILEVFGEMEESYGKKVSPVIRRRLLARKRRTEEAQHVGEVLAGVAKALKRANRRLARWPIEGDGFHVVRTGLRRTYRQGVKALRRAGERSTAENLHALRKRVKEHLYQVRLLSGLWDEGLRRHEARLSRLEATLGEHHNLHILRVALAGVSGLEHFFEFLAAVQDKLTRRALRLASHVFRRSPSRFVGKLERLWVRFWVS